MSEFTNSEKINSVNGYGHAIHSCPRR